MAGEAWDALIEPKLMFGLELCPTGPPLGIWPVVPEALIMTEGFLPCSPFCMVLPFTGDSLPCCTGAPGPVSDGPEAVEFAAWEKVLVALAYERLGSWAGTAVKGDDVPEADVEAALAVLAAVGWFWPDEIALVIRDSCRGEA